jgi:hypothetical protein
MDDHQSKILCYPVLVEDNHCDVFNFTRVLTNPTSVESRTGQQVSVELILHFKFCVVL